MTSFRRKFLFKLFKLSDACILITSFLITIWWITYNRNQFTLAELLFVQVRLINFIGFLGMIFLWHLLFNSFQLYRSRRLDSTTGEWKDIFKATTLGTAIFILAGFTFDISTFTPLFIATFWLSSTTLTILFRGILRHSLKKLRLHNRNLRFVLIAGTNQRAYDFARIIEEKREIGYRLIGYIDKNIHVPRKKVKLLGNLDDLSSIINSRIIDEVIIALPIKSNYEEIKKIVQLAEIHGIIIRYISQLFDTKIAQSKAEVLENFSFLTISSGPQDGWQYFTKRVLDFVLATVLLILASPIMIVSAIAIKCTSPGSIFFIQNRVGYNKRIFKLYKFRTMIPDAEKLQAKFDDLNEMDGPVFKIRNDPRITKLGWWLRKWSIDELPQLLNVLKGNMSLVGPRPLPMKDYSGFNQDWQRRRFSILPGITCTWQVNGRNMTSFEDWMKLDMEYIDNWTLSNDLKILFRTIPAVISRRGAS